MNRHRFIPCFLLAASAMAGSAPAAARQQANLLANPGFEDELSGPWEKRTPDDQQRSLDRVSGAAHSGQWCLVLENRAKTFTRLRQGSDHSLRIPAGSRVLMMFASGNHDPEQFEDPDDFRPSRRNVMQHVAFGAGAHFCLGAPLALGSKVVVIGGGSVAMDVAGSAIRLGSEVEIVSLEQRGAMPAPEDEVEDVLADGARIIDGAMVRSVDGGARLGLRCIRAELDPAAPAGDIRPLEVKGTEFDLEADTVILAIGQDPALLDWESVIRVSGNMVLVDERQMTSRRGVFAAGDVTNPERFVSTAMGDGKQAAQRIMEYLGQLGTVRGESSTLPEVAFTDLNTFYFPRAERWERDKVDARARAADFREIRQGFAAEQALAQAERCFSCGNCIQCNVCLMVCPDVAISFQEKENKYAVDLDHCKGCGICAVECPRSAMTLEEEQWNG